MTGREKIEAALSPEGTPRIPAVLCYEGIYVRDHWEQLTAHPWWVRESPDLDEQMAWHRDVIAKTGQDWYSVPSCLPRERRSQVRIEQGPDGMYRVDQADGRRVRLDPPAIGGWSRSGEIQSVRAPRLPGNADELDAAIPPEPVEFTHPDADGAGDLAARLRRETGDTLYPLGSVASPLWHCYGYWGFEGMMTMIADRPDLVARACERFLLRARASVRYAAALGAAGIWIEECLTDMISPQAFRTLNLACLRPLVEEIRAAGMHSIYYYCGNPAGKWDLLFDAGADALALEESKKGFAIDIEEIAARAAGRCAILGNLDAIDLLRCGDAVQLRAEIARQIRAGRRNRSRFVMSIGSPVTPETPVDRVRLYCDLVHELGGA